MRFFAKFFLGQLLCLSLMLTPVSAAEEFHSFRTVYDLSSRISELDPALKSEIGKFLHSHGIAPNHKIPELNFKKDSISFPEGYSIQELETPAPMLVYKGKKLQIEEGLSLQDLYLKVEAMTLNKTTFKFEIIDDAHAGGPAVLVVVVLFLVFAKLIRSYEKKQAEILKRSMIEVEKSCNALKQEKNVNHEELVNGYNKLRDLELQKCIFAGQLPKPQREACAMVVKAKACFKDALTTAQINNSGRGRIKDVEYLPKRDRYRMKATAQ